MLWSTIFPFFSKKQEDFSTSQFPASFQVDQPRKQGRRRALLLDAGPRVHLAQYPLPKTNGKGRPPKAATSNPFAGRAASYPHRSVNTQSVRCAKERNIFQQTCTGNSFFWWTTSRQEVEQENLSPIYCHHKSDVWIQSLNCSKYFSVPVQAICVMSQKKITLHPEHLQPEWKGRDDKGKQKTPLTSTSKINWNLLNWFWQVKLGT